MFQWLPNVDVVLVGLVAAVAPVLGYREWDVTFQGKNEAALGKLIRGQWIALVTIRAVSKTLSISSNGSPATFGGSSKKGFTKSG